MKKSMDERLVLSGPRDNRPDRLANTLANTPGFKDISVNAVLFQVTAKYRKGTVGGDLQVTFNPAGDDTEVLLRSSAHVDNIYALFSSPNKKLLSVAKNALTASG